MEFINDAHSQRYHFQRNMYSQMYNIYRVMSDVNTEFCIKHRSDEYYVDMAEYIYLVKNSNKLITNNLFFHGTDYHISHHLFGANTIMFKKMINNLKDILENKKIIDAYYFLHTEKVFGLSYIIDRYTKNEINTNSKEIIINNFYVYACDRFTDYLITTMNAGGTAKLIPGKYSSLRGRQQQNMYMHKFRVYIKKNTGYTDTQPEGTVDEIVNKVKSTIMIINKMEDIKW
jgi:hypothetical protein